MAIEHEAIKLGELELVYAPNIDMYSMTEAWKHEGSDPNKKPNDWLRQQWTQNYLKSLQGINLQSYGLKPQFASMGCKGTYANWMVFLAYAQYLSPKLHVIVNEYFTRIYTGDVTLIEEIYNQANDAGKKFIESRIKGKIKRRYFTDVLQAHDVTGLGYAKCTNAVYNATFEKDAALMRVEKGLKPTDQLRNHLSSVELDIISISEDVSANHIQERNVCGNAPCEKACYSVSRIVGEKMSEALRLIKQL